MRRAIAVLGISLIFGLAGCGGGSSTGTPGPEFGPHSLGQMRAAIQHYVDANLVRLGAPPKEIACVDKNVEAMSGQQIAERLVENGPPHPRSVVEYLGPLGKGCP